MHTTFIVRNLTAETIASIEALSPREAHDKLARFAFGDLRHCVSVRYGRTDAFRDRVEWNGLCRDNAPMKMTAEPRRGYRLFRFEA